MRFNSWVIELSATPLYLFIFFAALLLIFHLVLVVWLKICDVAWKRVDYYWLGATALGVFAASAQASHYLSDIYLRGFEIPRTEFAYQTLHSELQDPSGVCLPRVKTEYSPPDFDEIVKEQESICQWAKSNAAAMPSVLPTPFPLLENLGYKPFSGPAKYEADLIRRIGDFAQQYRDQQKRYAEFSASLTRSDLEDSLTVLGPLLLASALALRITKVSGEIAVARRRANEANPDNPPETQPES
jgi:hypothetical protein